MSTKDREEFVPQQYVRKWKEGNEEIMLRALKRFRGLRLRILFQIEEDKEDIARRENKRPSEINGPRPKRWTTLRGKTIQVKGIPTAGMVWQFVKACQDAAKEAAKR